MNYKGRFLKVMAAVCIAAAAAFAQTTQEMTINGIQCVLVEKGTFMMGGNSGEEDYLWDGCYPQHQVTLTRDYWVSKYPVTQGQYKAAIGTNPSSSNYGFGDNYPVNNVDWNDADAFCKAVGGRLLTDAEWEFAARGGNKSKGYIYSGSNNLDEVGWYYDNSGYRSHPVGQKSPNELGIYDMSGNVYEWVNDLYGSYSSSAQTDPTGPSTGSYRVYRGGSWVYDSLFCHVAYRAIGSPSDRGYNLGLRVAFNSENIKKIKFEANGGLAGDDISVPLGAYIGVPTNSPIARQPAPPTKTGYTFSGWWTASSGGRQWDFDNDIVTQDTVLYAKWKEKVAKPTAITNIVYNGNAQSGIAANAAYTITNGTAINAGNYTATVSLNDTANYVWDDNSKTDLTLPWSIAKAKITKPVVYTALVYTGSVQYADIDTNSAYTIIGNSAIAVGGYTASVVLKDKANYEWEDGTTIDLILNWAILKESTKIINVVWGENREFVYNKMVQVPQWSIEPAIIDKNHLRINGAQSATGKYTAQNNLAPVIVIMDEYKSLYDNYYLVKTSVDYEIIPKPLDVVLKDNTGKISDKVEVAKPAEITVGGAIDLLKAFIGYDGFAIDTVNKQADNAANSLSGEPKFEVYKLESGTRSRSKRDEVLRISDLLEKGEYTVNIKVSDIFAKNYELSDGLAVLKVSDSSVTFSMSRDGDTPIRQKQKSDNKHGILLEKAIVSQSAKINVKTPEQAQITLAVYDNAGNAVYKTSGRSNETFVWNLTNGAGRNVANGTYLIVVEARGAKGNYAYSVKVGVKR